MSDRFRADVYGRPPAGMSREEADRIIAEAEARGQHVMFGTGAAQQQRPPDPYREPPKRWDEALLGFRPF